MWFIDKLSMYQEHTEALPVVASQHVIRVDAQTNELLSDSPKSLLHEGSYSSVLTVRSNGTRVTVTGNPSRWNRADNLFGFTSISDCVAVYNNVLLSHGLPPFTPATYVDWRQTSENKKAELITNGAIFTHFDITRNMAVGRSSEHAFLKGLATLTIGKSKEPYLYSNQMTVDWYRGSTVRYTKAYVKSYDLVSHQKKRLKEATKKQKLYYQSLIDYCNEVGLVREEHSFKSPFLKKRNLNIYGRVQLNDLEKYANELGDAMKRLEVIDTKYEDIADQLLNAGVVKNRQSANATQSVAMQWLLGHSLDRKKSQYYEHRKRLLQIGIDIALPYDATKQLPQIRSTDAINVVHLNPPTWYQMPQVPTPVNLTQAS